MDAEKIICCERNGYGDGGYAMNNPLAYAFLMGMMRFMYGDGWQNQYGGNAEMQCRFNQLSNQISDNHNTDILSDLARGNYARIGELATNLGVDLRAIQGGICDMRSAIQQNGGDIRAGFQGLQGDVRFTGERVINANLMGVKDLQATFKDCCCEERLGQKDTIIAFNERMNGIANGITKGFSDIGFLLAQNKGETVNAINAAQQRTADLLNAHWKDEMSQRLQDEKFENSQLRQNIYIRDLYERGDGSGCGCRR